MSKILTISNANHFGLTSGVINIGKFSGGEVSLSIKEDLKGEDVFIIGSTNAPAENLLELLFAIDTANLLGAKKITAVIPYFAYARADREKFQGDAVSARTVAKMIEAVGGPQLEVISFDVHSERLKGFFRVPFKSLDISDIFSDLFKNMPGLSITAPDKGAEQKAYEFAKKVGVTNISVLQKTRLEDGGVVINGIAGDIGEKTLLFDDIVDSGGTIIKGAEFLRDHGAKEIIVAVTHMVWQGGGYQLLADSDIISTVYTTDTIQTPLQVPEKFEIISVAPVLQKIING